MMDAIQQEVGKCMNVPVHLWPIKLTS